MAETPSTMLARGIELPSFALPDLDENIVTILRLSLATIPADSTRPEVSGGKRVVFLRFRRSLNS